MLQEKKQQGIDNYGNTGRSNKRAWVEMSSETLEKGGIAHLLNAIFYTPEGIKTAVSKAVAILELRDYYRIVEHYEDDPRTAVYLARLFPEMVIHLVEYGTTGMLYSREEINMLPNVIREVYPNRNRKTII